MRRPFRARSVQSRPTTENREENSLWNESDHQKLEEQGERQEKALQTA